MKTRAIERRLVHAHGKGQARGVKIADIASGGNFTVSDDGILLCLQQKNKNACKYESVRHILCVM